jgi:CubicO group peptidase (beta-lactamase class C family)
MSDNRAHRFSVFLLTIFLAAVAAHAADRPCVPISGDAHPALAPFDEAVIDLMCANAITAATAAVMKDGVIVLERGYGWLDEERTQPLPPDALMRVASISKPITAAAVRVLIEDGTLTLNDKAFNLDRNGGILHLEPFPSLGDERIKNITIEHLLLHTAGWDRSEVGDLTYREVAIAGAMEIASPPGRINTMRYILGQPLQFDPGEKRAYSNIGYLALGLIVEQVSERELIDFIHERVLAPLGVPRSELAAGRTFKHDQSPREPHYDHSESVVNVYDPEGPRVPRAYGGWDHEARVGQGGHITTARTLLTFLQARYVNGPNIGLPRRGNEGPNWRWNHTGSLWGTSAIARQRGDGVSYAVIFNQRTSEGHYGVEIRNRLDEILDNGQIDWDSILLP